MKVLCDTRTDWKHREQCPHCRSRLVLEADDILVRRRSDYLKFWYGYICVVCKRIWWFSELEAGMLPDHVKEAAIARQVAFEDAHPELRLTLWERLKDRFFSRDSRAYWRPDKPNG